MVDSGTLIDGKYRVLSKLKEGGMGAIYKVHHDLIGDVRVMKVLRANARKDPELQRRFLREAKLFTRLQHPNIAAIHDFAFTDDGTAYIVMEFIDGLNLDDLIRIRGKMTVPAALEISRQCLRALDYLHGEKVIHRDISPENIMVSRYDSDDPQVKLIDLGIAKALDQGGETRVGMFIGKVRYSSPEQLSPGDYILDGRSDLYSLGIVMYMLLTGQSPIRGKTAPQLLASHFHEPPMPFEESDPHGEIPDGVRRAILKALEKEPSARYGSAAEFLRIVEELQQPYLWDGEETVVLSARRPPLMVLPPEIVEQQITAPQTPRPVETSIAAAPDEDEGEETVSIRRPAAPQQEQPPRARLAFIAGAILLTVVAAILLISALL